MDSVVRVGAAAGAAVVPAAASCMGCHLDNLPAIISTVFNVGTIAALASSAFWEKYTIAVPILTSVAAAAASVLACRQKTDGQMVQASALALGDVEDDLEARQQQERKSSVELGNVINRFAAHEEAEGKLNEELREGMMPLVDGLEGSAKRLEIVIEKGAAQEAELKQDMSELRDVLESAHQEQISSEQHLAKARTVVEELKPMIQAFKDGLGIRQGNLGHIQSMEAKLQDGLTVFDQANRDVLQHLSSMKEELDRVKELLRGSDREYKQAEAEKRDLQHKFEELARDNKQMSEMIRELLKRFPPAEQLQVDNQV